MDLLIMLAHNTRLLLRLSLLRQHDLHWYRHQQPVADMQPCAFLADGQIWIEHGYLNDVADLQQLATGQSFLQSHSVGDDELVSCQNLYHSPARVIEGAHETQE